MNSKKNLSTMKKDFGFLSCHFHKVEAWTWLRIREVLEMLSSARVESGSELFIMYLHEEDVITIMDFIKQMDTAYLHPRRDSYYVNFLQSIYKDFHVPANFRKSSCEKASPSPISKKNLSDNSNSLEDKVGLQHAVLSFAILALLFAFASHIESVFNL